MDSLLLRKHDLEGKPVIPEGTSIAEFLLENSINPTNQRLAIASLVFEKHQHMSAEDILEKVNSNRNNVNVSRATLYNTLNIFVQHGLLAEVTLDTHHIVFDTNTNKHHHVWNIETGALIDIKPVNVDLTGVIDPDKNVVIEDVDLVIKVVVKQS